VDPTILEKYGGIERKKDEERGSERKRREAGIYILIESREGGDKMGTFRMFGKINWYFSDFLRNIIEF
jgi:hypothetical protein